ncbi:MAG: hypothetical protein ACP5SH_17220, partial [Syntrophobacteraceae bacterium]
MMHPLDSYEDTFHPVLWRVTTFEHRLAALQQLEDAYAKIHGRAAIPGDRVERCSMGSRET